MKWLLMICIFFLTACSPYKKIVISLLLSSVVIFINLHLEPLTFGGFIFSRLEELSLPVSFVIEFLLLAFYLCFSNKDTLLFTLICSLTLSTTNLLFIKYTDFFIFAFLAFGLNRSEHALKMKQYAKSILFFQYFSFLLMNIRYPSFFKSMINSLT